ncbi:OmpA family protein [Chryseobacterium indologenes]|uniref:OmpA family protein n=1 Tax=Chryseobacterium indologenes TaxID=253 RepID=UPI000F4F5552|nr:OmpA family protein [Chryseobacterium indologenes]AYZ34482.1 OmpA family protein [Chryseobacterium indologenes]MBF6643032.1 OmpA family protein [Chryseobacterium indologenes]MBU3047603.1 OmpA family protein [Chryseobacterium indologenes]MEB4759139.1 OmpA family protein [Chryseobacterium indologenes]QQQ73086.1 OmpA family protein [Chryseobacterium indologenes]
MKLSLAIVALAMAIPTATYAQDSTAVSKGEYPNTFSSGSANVSPFTNQSKRFNDWSISAGVGVPLMQSADLTSIKNGNGKNLFGYSAYVSIDKAITHAFGLKLQYDRGETRQGWFNTKDAAPDAKAVAGRTQYDAISILGDINFSNLLRRVDNHSPYRWALHGYGGVGTIAYRAYQKSINGQQLMTEVKPFKLGSFFAQAGAGLKFKVNRRIDIEGRLMYVITGDDTFDGGGDPYSEVNRRSSQVSDNFFNATLGLSLKLGKHESHLMWHDPLQEIYYKLDVLANKNQDIEVCKKGDADNDGVCDDWDRQLDTPAGARVDGAGVALDTDLDGVIDLYDKCVTVPGPVENNGCPNTAGPVIETETKLEGIEFDLNSDRILPSNTPILNNAVNYINSSNGGYKVIGATDTRGTDAYNQKLSERRANNVKNYLIKNGVQSGKLQSVGKGEKDLKYPECEPATKCPEWKNRANRRVYFEAK